MKKGLVVLAIGLLLAADRPMPNDANEELKKMAGTWALVAEVSDGQKLAGPDGHSNPTRRPNADERVSPRPAFRNPGTSARRAKGGW